MQHQIGMGVAHACVSNKVAPTCRFQLQPDRLGSPLDATRILSVRSLRPDRGVASCSCVISR
jgi:hypothetical protein